MFPFVICLCYWDGVGLKFNSALGALEEYNNGHEHDEHELTQQNSVETVGGTVN